MEELMSFCRSRAIILESSGVYGGAATTYDFGPVGAQLKKNIVDMWWRDFVENRDDVAPLDTGVILNPAVWRGSGHVEEFTDPLTQCETCKRRFRADKLLEEADGGAEHWDGKTLEEMGAALVALGVACPSCGAKAEAGLGTPRPFNLLFETSIGPVQDGSSTAFLRPETAQGALVQGPLVLSLTRARLPAGLAQVGKSFRNEIAVGQSLFRTREFEQAEIQVFCEPESSGDLLQQWVEDCNTWLVDRLGLTPSRIRRRVHEESELAHYALATTDIEFNYPFGWGELWGIANRGKYDLLRHEAASGQDMRFRDPRDGGRTAFHPFVVEPALGVGRLVLAVLSDCLVTEAAPAAAKGKKQAPGRLVLRVPDEIAPSRAAVLPLMNKDGMPERAAEIAAALRRMGAGGVQVDTSGSIGKRYRRQDEVGTPLCVTVDYTTLEDGTVTVRCRDTMRQARLSVADIEDAIGPRGLTRDKLQGVFATVVR
ncbi:glyQS [Symbiodinium sp. KB8]|nr:glyQS [Symbiodinium sp. KB8]